MILDHDLETTWVYQHAMVALVAAALVLRFIVTFGHSVT